MKEVQVIETEALLMKLFNGSLSCFFHEYLSSHNFTDEELLQLKNDYTFKRVFGYTGNEDITIGLLNSILCVLRNFMF